MARLGGLKKQNRSDGSKEIERERSAQGEEKKTSELGQRGRTDSFVRLDKLRRGHPCAFVSSPCPFPSFARCTTRPPLFATHTSPLFRLTHTHSIEIISFKKQQTIRSCVQMRAK